MRERALLHIITAISISGWILLFRRKGEMKDWFLIYLAKTLISTLLDVPVTKKNYVRYPNRYFPKMFDSNIIFLYILFPLSCVIYNQFTYRMKPMKTILSVFLFSAPMGLIEGWLEKYTNLVEFRKGWNNLHTIAFLTVSFWSVRVFIEGIRFIDKKRNRSRQNVDAQRPAPSSFDPDLNFKLPAREMKTFEYY